MKILNKFEFLILCILSLGLVSCSSKNTEKKLDQSQKISVLSSRGLHLVKPLFDEFTKETGIEVEASNNKTGVFFSLLKSGSVKADLLLTTDLGSLVKASNDSLLDPVSFDTAGLAQSDYMSKKGTWFGLSRRTRVIFYNAEKAKELKVKLDEISYLSIAEERFKEQLCLRTSQKVYNQALVADFINRYGANETASLLKSWVKNLAAPVFASDREVIKAVSRGKCLFGIANSYYLGKMEEKSDLKGVKILWSNKTPAHVNLSGIGLLKNAPNKVAAEKLIKWLLSDKAQSMFASVNFEYPVSSKSKVNDLLKAYGTPVVEAPAYLDTYVKLHAQALEVIKASGYK